mgnify:CR=1 FL=1
MDSPEQIADMVVVRVNARASSGYYIKARVCPMDAMREEIASALRARDEAHAEVVMAARKLVKAADVVPSHGGYSFVPSGVHAVDLGHLYAALSALTPKEAP